MFVKRDHFKVVSCCWMTEEAVERSLERTAGAGIRIGERERVVWKRRLDELSPVLADVLADADAVVGEAVEVEGVERATIGPILMQFVPSCRRWGRICSYHAVEDEEDESIPLSEGRVPSPLSRVEGLGDLVHGLDQFWIISGFS